MMQSQTMKTKLTPLALLIPAVVLAQPAPMPPTGAMTPPPGAMRAPPFNPANRLKAADALNNAKKQDQALSPSGEVGATDSYNLNSRTNFSGFYPSCC